MPQVKIYASHAQQQAAYRRRMAQAREQQLREQGIPSLPALPAMPGTARWQRAISNAEGLLSMVIQEMEEYYEERSETWQEGERGDAFQERLEAIGVARDAVAEVLTV